MIKVSIIVPVYNREKTIGRCIESIIAQDFRDFECILVDDGSKDNSLEICKSYILQDERLKVIHKENGGVGSARNSGLDIAKGEWVCFVDSDDTIKYNHLSNMLKSENDDVDMILCGFETYGNPEALNHSYQNKIFKGKKGISDFFFETDAISCMPICDRMFRQSIIDNINLRFDETLPLSEDRLFSCHFLLQAHGIGTVKEKTYVVFNVDSASLTHRTLNVSESRNRFYKLKKITRALSKQYCLREDSKRLADEYMESLYASLINAYRQENRIIAYHITRLFHKLGLL